MSAWSVKQMIIQKFVHHFSLPMWEFIEFFILTFSVAAHGRSAASCVCACACACACVCAAPVSWFYHSAKELTIEVKWCPVVAWGWPGGCAPAIFPSPQPENTMETCFYKLRPLLPMLSLTVPWFAWWQLFGPQWPCLCFISASH